MVEKLFPDPFLKSENWAYLWSIIQFDFIVWIFQKVCVKVKALKTLKLDMR